MPFLCILRLNPTFPSFSFLLRRERNQPQVKPVIVGTQPASEPAVVMLPSLTEVAPAPVSHICCLVGLKGPFSPISSPLTKSKHYCGICKKVWDLQIVEVGCTVTDGEECECMQNVTKILATFSRFTHYLIFCLFGGRG
ncbi:uncharacterized protein LOC108339640 [Vigna angularis]|uniref:uncharacterized protein LOC108339640 n=1 Tax=Phaseolus angularis TaxID=3914 RepID=UPI0022B5C046|nr:uncharacterized protein LOC108339640 [Vigna angularis]